MEFAVKFYFFYIFQLLIKISQSIRTKNLLLR
jgi:hypothetical protein